MRHRFLFPVILVLGACAMDGCESPSGVPPTGPPGSTGGPPPGRLVWSDEFDGPAGSSPDPGKWTFDIGTDWGNAQLEYDTDRPVNVSLDGLGHLAITARRESPSSGGPTGLTAPTMPGISWHVAQAYWWIASLPRFASAGSGGSSPSSTFGAAVARLRYSTGDSRGSSAETNATRSHSCSSAMR